MVDNNEISKLRKNYSLSELRKNKVLKDPFEQFLIWFHDAVKSKIAEPNAMILATADGKGIPSARVVLLKGIEPDGLKFFTNYNSSKAKELNENPNAALLFFWHELERQIRVSGKVEKISGKDSEEYFKNRPYESQIGAWASNQSEVIESRKLLEVRFDELKTKYKDGEVPLPDFWGGYKLIPFKFEFWQGRQSRLHDRILYTKENENWKIERLSP